MIPSFHLFTHIPMGLGSSCIKDNDCNFIKLYTMKHEQNGQNFEDHIFKNTSMKENV